MRRASVFALLMIAAVLLQTTVFARLTLFGVAPDLMLLVVTCLALLEGPLVGAASGFAGGLVRDLLLEAPKGLSALSYLLVGYAVGRVRPYVHSSATAVIVVIFSGSLLGSFLYEVAWMLLGGPAEPVGRLVRVGLIVAAYNALIAPFVYPLLRKAAGACKKNFPDRGRSAAKATAEKVLRW